MRLWLCFRQHGVEAVSSVGERLHPWSSSAGRVHNERCGWYQLEREGQLALLDERGS